MIVSDHEYYDTFLLIVQNDANARLSVQVGKWCDRNAAQDSIANPNYQLHAIAKQNNNHNQHNTTMKW